MARTEVFDKNPGSRIPRSSLDLSYERIFTADFQYLYPVFLKGCIPGDVFHLGHTAVIRFMPLVAPILSGVKLRTYYFFVPYRIIFPQWEDFITKGFAGTGVVTLPLFDPDRWADPADVVALNTLWDFFGFPTTVVPPAAACPVDFPRMAYLEIWNQYFMDETLQTPISLTADDDPSQYDLRLRNWSKDYFCSALPFQQRGTPPALPVVGQAPVDFDVDIGSHALDANWRALSIFQLDATTPEIGADGGGVANMKTNFDNAMSNGGATTVDGAGFSGADIADFRLAMALQQWMEKNARGGARYNEFLWEQFKVSNGDDRLQRPEFIGGSASPVIISEVLQTSATAAEPTPQGTLAGHGLGISNTGIGSYRVTEFGLIMGLACFTADALYQQGINREWMRRTTYDYPFPIFTGLSEQEIFNAEIYVTSQAGDPTGAINLDVFGFTGRYNEERFMPNQVSGIMRTTFAYWHQSRIFSSLPTLDSTFISTPPRNDILSVTSEPAFVVRFGNQVTAQRPIPFMPVPVSLGGVV